MLGPPLRAKILANLGASEPSFAAETGVVAP